MADPRAVPTQLLPKGEVRLRAALSEAGYAKEEQDRAIELLRRAPVLPLVALASTRRRGSPDAVDLSEGAARSTLEPFLASLADEQGFSRDDVSNAIRLIQEGVLTDDLAGVTRATQTALGRIPESVVQYLDSPGDAGATILDVLGALPSLVGDLVGGLGKLLGGTGRPDPIGAEVLNALYTIQALDLIRDWVVEVSGYESVQLAIVAYARVHGWQVDRDQIEGIRKSLQEDDLSPALVEAVRFFESTEHGGFLKAARALSASAEA